MDWRLGPLLACVLRVIGDRERAERAAARLRVPDSWIAGMTTRFST